jgi:Holliday junction DNA helicase RuvA
MIAMLRGRLLHRDGPRGILDVAGVGYEIFAPSRALDSWTGEAEVVVHVSTQVREDAIQLFGFGSDLDRRAFSVLLGISGFGPKLALQTLDALGVEELTRAVEKDDTHALSRIPGVGHRKAQRLALELKGKLPVDLQVAARTGRPVTTRVPADPLALALAQLEYGRSEIERAMQALAADGVPADAQPDVRLKAALRYLSGGAS